MFYMLQVSTRMWEVSKGGKMVFRGTKNQCFQFMNGKPKDTPPKEEPSEIEYEKGVSGRYKGEGNYEYNFRLRVSDNKRLSSLRKDWKEFQK